MTEKLGKRRTGGARTVAGKEKSTKNLAAGGLASITTGLERWYERGMAFPCDLCPQRETCAHRREGEVCVLMVEGVKAIVETVMAMEHVQEIMRPFALEMAKMLVGVAHYDQMVGHLGPHVAHTDKSGQTVVEWQPSFERRDRMAARAASLAMMLGITPGAKERLGLAWRSSWD
jgi:uncharacterized short protein YbdD (DUF466 family)